MRRLDLTRTLLIILVLDLLLQGFGLARSWDVYPAVQNPAGDALEYWDWAGRIAEGELVGETPFLSAPLYPYFVGLVRACGGGMAAVYVLQLLMRTLTAWILARCATRLFGHLGFGLATAVVFLWLQEPAYYAVRLLNSSLQLLVLSGLIHACIAWREELTLKRQLGLGALLGLSLLSNPSLLIGLPFFAWWLGVRPPALRATATVLGMTFLMLAPATLHNLAATSGSSGGTEFILLSAQSGVTYSHGNAAGAVGTYTPLAGVSLDRQDQNTDAYRLASAETGKEGWGNTSDYFLQKGLDWQLSNPGDAIALAFTKLRWFFCGRNYGDLFNINLENRDPDWPRQVPLPGGLLELGWILPAAFYGLFLLIRRDRRQAIPIATLLLAVLFVVVVFWYSPRYRLPAAPIAALLAPWAVFLLAKHLKALPRIAAIAICAIAPAAVLEAWTLGTGFDPLENVRGQYEAHIGLNYIDLGEFAKAQPRLERALAVGHENAEIHHGIAECQVKAGAAADQQGQRPQADALYLEAVGHYRRAVELNPSRLDTRFSLGSVLDYIGQKQEARQVWQDALTEAVAQEDAEMTERLRQRLGR
ncbi:MAG: tetratricopeptide repeat protein [Planctomycetota bacterium]